MARNRKKEMNLRRTWATGPLYNGPALDNSEAVSLEMERCQNYLPGAHLRRALASQGLGVSLVIWSETVCVTSTLGAAASESVMSEE